MMMMTIIFHYSENWAKGFQNLKINLMPVNKKQTMDDDGFLSGNQIYQKMQK